VHIKKGASIGNNVKIDSGIIVEENEVIIDRTELNKE
jgi:UDP-3-O-[3-hydroxymyristoyl] glucosamine N-acyltransferase